MTPSYLIFSGNIGSSSKFGMLIERDIIGPDILWFNLLNDLFDEKLQ